MTQQKSEYLWAHKKHQHCGSACGCIVDELKIPLICFCFFLIKIEMPSFWRCVVCGCGIYEYNHHSDLPPFPGPSSSSSPSLMTKSLSLEPPCSPCGHQEALDADGPQQLSSDPGPSSSSSGPASLEGGVGLTERRRSANGLLQVNDTGPPELPATSITPPSKSRPPLPGPKPQGTNLT